MSISFQDSAKGVTRTVEYLVATGNYRSPRLEKRQVSVPIPPGKQATPIFIILFDKSEAIIAYKSDFEMGPGRMLFFERFSATNSIENSLTLYSKVVERFFAKKILYF